MSLEFHDLGNATEILLTHGQFPSVESRENTITAGWVASSNFRTIFWAE